jgi:hypothetical protein
MGFKGKKSAVLLIILALNANPWAEATESIRAPYQSGEGAAIGSIISKSGRPEMVSLTENFIARDKRLSGWFIATNRLLVQLERDIVEAQFLFNEAEIELSKANASIESAKNEAVKFAIRYGVTSDVGMLELGQFIDMLSGQVKPSDAILSLQDLHRMQKLSDAIIKAAERKSVNAMKLTQQRSVEIERLVDELKSLREFAGHLATVDDLIADSQVPSSSIDALLFTVSAPKPSFPGDNKWPWLQPDGRNVEQDVVRESARGKLNIERNKISQSVLSTLGSVNSLYGEPSASSIDLVLRVPAEKLEENINILKNHSFAVFPTATLKINDQAVQVIVVDDDNVNITGINSTPSEQWIVMGPAARVALQTRKGDTLLNNGPTKRRFDRAGVATPLVSEENVKILAEKTYESNTRNNFKSTGESTLKVAGFAPLFAGVGAVVSQEVLSANSEEYLIAVDLPGGKASTLLTWTLMMHNPIGTVLRTTAAPDPYLFYSASEAASVLGLLRYEQLTGDSDPRRIVITDNYIADKIAVNRYPVLGEFACHSAIAAQLAGALAETVLRGLGERLDPSRFGGCYNPRLIREDSGPSFHAWGLAVDLNVSDNQMYSAGNMDPIVIEVFKAWGFRWGGDWSVLDPMHFEAAALLRPEK